MTQDTDLLLVAEKLGNALDRLDRLESELTAQAVPLQAAGTAQDSALRALEAALAGIKALNQHVLGNDLGALSVRVNEAGKQFEMALAGIESKLGGVSQEFSQKLDGLRGELVEIATTRRELTAVKDDSAKRFAELAGSFAEEVKTLRQELAAKATEFATPKGFEPAGEWESGKSYARLAVVTLNGSSYISNTDGNTEKPSAKSARWQVLARRGAGGVMVQEGTQSAAELICDLSPPEDPLFELTEGTTTDLTWDATEVGASLYDPLTGIITVPSAGVYFIKCTLQIEDPAPTDFSGTLEIVRNNGAVSQIPFFLTGSVFRAEAMVMIDCSEGAQLSARCTQLNPGFDPAYVEFSSSRIELFKL